MVVIIYCYICCKDKAPTWYLNGLPPNILAKHKTFQYIVKRVVIIYDDSAIEPCLKKNQNVVTGVI